MLSHYVEMTFLKSRKSFFPFRTLSNIISRSFSKKMRLRWTFKLLTKIMGWPLWKNGHFHIMLKWYFCSAESPFSYLEHYKTSIVDLFKGTWDSGEFSNFWRKSWVNPFGKNEHCPTMLKWHFSTLESLFFGRLDHYWTLCLGLFQRKWDWEEYSNFFQKSWANPLGKMDIVPLC